MDPKEQNADVYFDALLSIEREIQQGHVRDHETKIRDILSRTLHRPVRKPVSHHAYVTEWGRP